MSGFTIETGYEITEIDMMDILQEMADMVKSGKDLQDHELMDGSFLINTSKGQVFLIPVNEEI